MAPQGLDSGATIARFPQGTNGSLTFETFDLLRDFRTPQPARQQRARNRPAISWRLWRRWWDRRSVSARFRTTANSQGRGGSGVFSCSRSRMNACWTMSSAALDHCDAYSASAPACLSMRVANCSASTAAPGRLGIVLPRERRRSRIDPRNLEKYLRLRPKRRLRVVRRQFQDLDDWRPDP